MAPTILPRDWLFLHSSYAALDEYLRWSQSRQGGLLNLDPESGAIVSREDEQGKNLPISVHRNLLDHLHHVFTKDGTGPSVLDLVLEMLPAFTLKEMRLISKSIGTAATKAYSKTIRLPVDTFYGGPLVTNRLGNFVTQLLDSAKRAGPKLKLESWLISPEYVKELVFYADPLASGMLTGLFTDFYLQLEANDIFDASIAVRAARQEGRKFLVHPRGETQQQYWVQIMYLIEKCSNLEVFTWASDVWQPVQLLQVLAFNCPKLAKLDLNFAEPLLANASLKADFKHKQIPPLEQITYTLPLDTEIHLRVAVRKDEGILPILLHIGAFTRRVDTLTIDRSQSDAGCSAWEQGWDTERPIIVDGQRLWPATKAVVKPLFEVRALHMISFGNKSTYVMPLLDTTSLRELTINRCLNVEFILEPLVREAKLLTSVAMLFGEMHEDFVEEPRRYHHLKVQDYRFCLDFLRAGNFTLTDLLLHADFADSQRSPKTYSLLVPELWFAIQAHMATLVRLSVLNPQDDFRVTDIEELGRCSPHLQELRIQARMGVPISEASTPRTQGLAYSMGRALLAFRTHKTLRVFAIMKSDSTEFNPDDDPRMQKFMLDSNLEAVTNAIAQGVPIKLFTYMEETRLKPATAHFFYNKTPLEPDVTWGVCPYPPASVRKDAQSFKGFEFHEQLPGARGSTFDETANQMLIEHERLVKELQLWHPYTKRGGATFRPEPFKLPSDTARKVIEPISPATYVGDFGDPRERPDDPVILAQRFAEGLPYVRSLAGKAGFNLNLSINRTTKPFDWDAAKHPNFRKYYISKQASQTSWRNPSKIKPLREEKWLRLLEEDRNELFGKVLPSHDPIAISEAEFDAMTGRDLYQWAELYDFLQQGSIDKLKILEAPLTESNREQKYKLLDEYLPKSMAWDIDNPFNFAQAKYNLCARQRTFIAKEAIARKLIIPEPISEDEFWEKGTNNQLVWLHLNGYVDNALYPALTLAFALQPWSEFQKAIDDPRNDDVQKQMEAFFNEVHETHVPHARANGRLTFNSIPEAEFQIITSKDLYEWALSRGLQAVVSDTDSQNLSNDGRISYTEAMAGALRGEILANAAKKGHVTLRPTNELEVRGMNDDLLYNWAVSRGLLKPLPLKDGTSTGISTAAQKMASYAGAQRNKIIKKGLAARYIIAAPFVPPRPAPAEGNPANSRAHYQTGKMSIGNNRRGLQAYDEASEFVGDEADDLRRHSKDDLILRVMSLCTDTPLAKEVGMKGLLEEVSKYGKEELITILLEYVDVDEEDEDEDEDYL